MNASQTPTSPLPAAVANGRWSALPVLVTGAFMVVLDFFIVNVALPSIATGLHAGQSSLEWVVAGYGLAFAALLITAGRLGDEYGRRRMFTIGLALFTVTSLACGLASDPTTLVLARIAQGAAGGVLMPQVLSIISVTYTGRDHARALSIYGMALGLAAVGGQLIGGALIQSNALGLGWRGCFLINVPIGIAAIALAPRLVPESRAEVRTPIDRVGVVGLAVGLIAILLPLIEGRQYGWPAWTWLSLALAPVLLGGFILWQARLGRSGRAPLLDLGLFGSRTVSAGLATQLALASVQASFFVFLGLYLQQGRGLDPLQAGLVFTILAVAYVVVSGPAPGLTARHGRRVLTVGGVALTAGCVWTAGAVADVGTGGSIAVLAPGLALVGAGVGLCFTPLTQLVLGGIAPAQAGAASGMLATTQQVGFSLGVAITGVIFFSQHRIAHAYELSLVQLAVFAVEIVVMSRLLPKPSAEPARAPHDARLAGATAEAAHLTASRR